MDRFIEKLKTLTILYAEDDTTLQSIVEQNLSFFFKDVSIASNGEEALEHFHNKKIDVVILDIKMPKINGLEVAKIIREENVEVPIIIMTGHSDKEYLIDAVKLKLEDYLVKPVQIDELLKVFKKIYDPHNILDTIIHFRNGTIYDRHRRVTIKENREIRLGQKEEKLLYLLSKNRSQIVSKEEINHYIWNGEMNDSSYRNLIRNLRAKIGEESIETIPSVGLKIVYT